MNGSVIVGGQSSPELDGWVLDPGPLADGRVERLVVMAERGKIRGDVARVLVDAYRADPMVPDETDRLLWRHGGRVFVVTARFVDAGRGRVSVYTFDEDAAVDPASYVPGGDETEPF